ncbi:GNAT family N-acetyltransferase [Paenarthrobacter sp. AR 02]|uniref:GNAT family N-acetyltransferase n=1 Tax=Paenarthrobacter sp. AR 02 TaxID=2899821 RepID=UPI001F44F4ED|nr:GNAT family N-acetyltransferase [Paenarthrobacter sp. AR 02]MCF3138408.1 GNAT family N-acetyltransferase [Paenarthrobacter sp. AR 02]
MASGSGVNTVRPADLSGADAGAVSRLVEAYLMQTEREKAEHLGGIFDDAALPGRYREEVDAPELAYRSAAVYLAELDDLPVGIVVVQQSAEAREIKRFWVEPSARGHRVGSALMDAAMKQRDLPIRLTVWDWRDDAIRMYAKRGFAPVPSWEDRPRLLCMEAVL